MGLTVDELFWYVHKLSDTKKEESEARKQAVARARAQKAATAGATFRR